MADAGSAPGSSPSGWRRDSLPNTPIGMFGCVQVCMQFRKVIFSCQLGDCRTLPLVKVCFPGAAGVVIFQLKWAINSKNHSLTWKTIAQAIVIYWSVPTVQASCSLGAAVQPTDLRGNCESSLDFSDRLNENAANAGVTVKIKAPGF
ncbi:hypothetical protein AB3X96_34945 [Paraburkholderia sp. BR13439]|uniref:hypothetical protein n=1 Tax=unclassified Paraburkholderia TaxID=2615204 RepID=UPI0034CDC5A1